MTPIINLEGKVGLITGIANEKSISTGVAEACAQAGAKLIITYQNDKTRAFIEPVIHRLRRRASRGTRARGTGARPGRCSRRPLHRPRLRG